EQLYKHRVHDVLPADGCISRHGPLVTSPGSGPFVTAAEPGTRCSRCETADLADDLSCVRQRGAAELRESRCRAGLPQLRYPAPARHRGNLEPVSHEVINGSGKGSRVT